MGTYARLGSRWARLPHAGFAGNRALCALLLCKSCFIRDIDRCGPMAALLAVHALRALSWAYMRIWGSAGSCHTPPRGVLPVRWLGKRPGAFGLTPLSPAGQYSAPLPLQSLRCHTDCSTGGHAAQLLRTKTGRIEGSRGSCSRQPAEHAARRWPPHISHIHSPSVLSSSSRFVQAKTRYSS